jgi:plasmid replication initiation protein
MSKSSIIQISNVLNLTRQEFDMVEKHIFLSTLIYLKDKQGFEVENTNEKEVLEVTFSSSILKETNKERVKEALEKITSRKIHFDKSTKNKDSYGYIVPFSFASYESVKGNESRITIHLNGACKKLFLELANGYTKTDLQAIVNLKSTYSIRIYELMTQHLRIGEWIVSITDLRNYLDIGEKYANFSQFETKILKYSQNELREHCNLHFEWEILAKERRKITVLKFYIRSIEKQEKIELRENIRTVQDYVSNLSPARIAEKFHRISQKYTLADEQINHIVSDNKLFNEFIRIDLIIESMIEKGKPPKDCTRYLAKSIGLDKLKIKKSKNNNQTLFN